MSRDTHPSVFLCSRTPLQVAACVQTLPGVTSVYEWEGKVWPRLWPLSPGPHAPQLNEDEEQLLFIKTAAHRKQVKYNRPRAAVSCAGQLWHSLAAGCGRDGRCQSSLQARICRPLRCMPVTTPPFPSPPPSSAARQRLFSCPSTAAATRTCSGCAARLPPPPNEHLP